MSLIAWFPLNGNLNNQGLSNSTLTNYGATVNSNGKIGSCYSFDGSNDYMLLSEGLPQGTTKFSFACWVYNTAFNGTNTLYTQRASVGGGLALFISDGGINIITDIKDSNDRWYCTANLTTNKWYHICITYDQIKTRVYLNGSLFGSNTLSYTPTLATHGMIGSTQATETTNSSANFMQGYMNDIRIYDHCLSAKEVKEISKGLILHYPLNIPSYPYTNLVKNKTYVVYNNYSVTASLTKLSETYEGCDIYRLSMTPDSSHLSNFQTSLWNHGIYGFSTTFSASTKYCFWIYYRPVSNNDVRVGGTASNIGGWTEIAPTYYKNGWYRVGQYRDGSITSDKTDNIFTSFYCPSAISGTPITIDFCCPHLVKGSSAIIEETDYEQASMNTTIDDCSGYRYNGTYGGNLLYSTGGPRYNGSTNFTPTSYIGLTSPLNVNNTQVTFSWWMTTSTPTTTMCIWNGRATMGETYAVFALGGVFRFDDGAQHSLGYTIPTNTWEHYCIIRDTSNIKLYVNGILKVTTTSTSFSSIGTYATIGASSVNTKVGSDNTLTGNLSDFRIYATALSADDIKELYEVGASIDKDGNMYCYEFQEE